MRKILKKIIPWGMVRYVRLLQSHIAVGFAKLGGRFRFTSNLFYVFNDSFGSEHKAVLKGRVAYQSSFSSIGESCALLRRNIHRIEKGLIMRPRRAVFAEGFIEDTVICYRKSMESSKLSTNEKKWATDVLEEYFNVVGNSKIIDKARRMFKEARDVLDYEREFKSSVSLISSGSSEFKPYIYNQLPKVCIEIDDLEKLFLKRRSVRWYLNKPVQKNLVQRAANIASLAPSACNRQPYRFLFCNNKEKVVSIAKCASGTVGFSENLPSIIVVVGDLSAYQYERDRHLIYIDGSLGTMQLMLALETLGLSTCPINWPEIDANEAKIRNIIKLEEYERVVMLLAVGYADEEFGIPFSQKKINELILEDISQ